MLLLQVAGVLGARQECSDGPFGVMSQDDGLDITPPRRRRFEDVHSQAEECFWQEDVMHAGSILSMHTASSHGKCCSMCSADIDCGAWTWSEGTCTLHSSSFSKYSSAGAKSGYRTGGSRYIPIELNPERADKLGGFVWYNFYGVYPPSLYSHYTSNLKTLMGNVSYIVSIK